MIILESLNVVDEQLSNEPLFRIRNANGEIVVDNCSIELITQVLQNGTPVNKLLFDKIDSNTENMYYFLPTGKSLEQYLEGVFPGMANYSGFSNEGKIKMLEEEIQTLKSEISSLKDRVSALE